MKLEHKSQGPRKYGTKAGEVLRHTPEVEQPLEVDLQRVVDIAKEANLEGPYRSDYELLLGIVGGKYLEQLRPLHREEANEKFAALSDGKNKLRFQLIQIAAQSKLFDSAAFAKRQWTGKEIRDNLDDNLVMLKIRTGQPWLTALELVVLFPEEKQRIIHDLKPAVSERLKYIEVELTKDPEAVLWEDLVAIKMLFPEHAEVQIIARAHWALWQKQVEGSLGRARDADTDARRKTGLGAALGISIGMHILAAEKAMINDQGLPEIAPASKKLPIGPGLPERTLV